LLMARFSPLHQRKESLRFRGPDGCAEGREGERMRERRAETKNVPPYGTWKAKPATVF
jgi:hypothetical protein